MTKKDKRAVHISNKVVSPRRDRNIVDFSEAEDNPEKELQFAEETRQPAKDAKVLVGIVSAYDGTNKIATVKQTDGSFVSTKNYSGFNIVIDSPVAYMLDERGEYTILGTNQTENTWGLGGDWCEYKDCDTLSDDSVVLVGNVRSINSPSYVSPNAYDPLAGSGFIQCVSADGTALWSYQFGEDEGIVPLRCVALSDDTVVVVGTFNDSITVGASTYFCTNNNDIFIGRVNSSGALLWHDIIAADDECIPDDLVRLSDDSVIFSSRLYSTGDSGYFGATTVTVPGTADSLGVVAKLTSSGVWSWVQPVITDGDIGNVRLSVTSTDDIYVAGSYQAKFVTIDTITHTNTLGLTPPNIRVCMFAALLDSAGTAFWIETGEATSGGPFANNKMSVSSVVTDSNDDAVIIAGYNTSSGESFDFGTVTISGLYGGFAQSEVLAIKIDYAAVWQWAAIATGSSIDFPAMAIPMTDGSVSLVGTYGSGTGFPSGGGSTTFSSISLTPSTADGNTFVSNVNVYGAWSWANSATGDGNFNIVSFGSFDRVVSLSYPLFCITKLSNNDLVVAGYFYEQQTGSVQFYSLPYDYSRYGVLRITDTGDWP